MKKKKEFVEMRRFRDGLGGFFNLWFGFYFVLISLIFLPF